MYRSVTEERRLQSLLSPTTSFLARIPLVTLVISACSLLLACSPKTSFLLQFDREAAAHGQLWQIITGHLTHWGWNHLTWDLAVFAVLGALCESINRRLYLTCLAVSAILIPLGVCFYLPDLNTYRGLSGIDTGLFTMLCSYLLIDKWATKEWPWVTVLAFSQLGLCLKFAFEIVTGRTMFVDSVAADFQPVPLAHVIGACVGIVVAVWPALLRGDSSRLSSVPFKHKPTQLEP